MHGGHEHEGFLSWHPDLFVAGWRPGRLHNRLQRGAVGLGEWGQPCSRLAWLVWVAVVVELCVSMVCCYLYWLACALSWHQDIFVAVAERPGRVHNRLQRGAVGVGEWGHALACVVGLVRCGC